jgi:phosphatidate cytidylyltransferase
MNGFDPHLVYIVSGLFGVLVVASIIGGVLRLTVRGESGQATLSNLNARTRSWWVMCIVFVVAAMCGRAGSTILFALMSFLALREYITLTPTRRADHRALFWVFVVILPVQYYLVYLGNWYGLFAIFIPVYAFIFLPMRQLMADDYEDFLARTAKIQWGLMVCVYFVSHAPALLSLEFRDFKGHPAALLFFLTAVVESSDVAQYVWGKTLGRRKIAPNVSPNKTVVGLVGGVLTASAVGAGLWWATPFSPLAAFGISLAITITGFFGGLTMSAIKRDSGVKDYGTLIRGHGGMMDRIDSICFAAPIFFHLVRYYYTV